MIKIDKRFPTKATSLLKKTIGQQFIKYKCDPFTFNNCVFERLGLYFEKDILLLLNEVHVVDYYGTPEDICLLEIFEAEDEDIKSGLEDTEQVSIPVNGILKKITLVQERQSLFKNNIQTYEVLITRGLILHTDDGREIAFVKTNPFVEEIAIIRGNNLIDEFPSVDSIKEGFKEEYSLEAERYAEVIQ